MKKSERIARAICRVRGNDPEVMVLPSFVLQLTHEGGVGGGFAVAPTTQPQPLWTMRLPEAYAALEALGLSDD